MSDTEDPRILATPASGLIDEPVSLVLRGFGARQVVTVRSRVTVPDGPGFAAAIVIVTDDTGTADLATTTPLNGSYLVADAGGLIWSLDPDDETSPVGLNTRFIDSGLQPYTVELTAEVDGVVVASGAWERLPTRPDVERHVVRERGLVGTLFLPAAEGPHPVVLVVPGSDGGIPEHLAALYAAHGYGALALGYFAAGEPGLLPETLTEIPLEYFETALDWITDHPALDEQVLVANGTSRGGELVLLLGSRYPQITAVIAWVPSNYLQAAIQGAGATEERTSWTFGGEDLPYLRLTADGDLSAIGKGWSAPDALDQRAGALSSARSVTCAGCGTSRIRPGRRSRSSGSRARSCSSRDGTTRSGRRRRSVTGPCNGSRTVGSRTTWCTWRTRTPATPSALPWRPPR